ncbi:juxtaposed with another zinc finger protein 1 isoform X1 [Diachasmimorpha longicaudata]|uniref:juxtaposed with another zinc finger protein 1 isoform X1 n=1 Tax=Diachasmimorpha longicaudata TaxID=58733 RepID=UPI0030B8EEEA
MAVFMLNVCKFNSCGLTFKSLGHLIQHIEETHIDYDPLVVEQSEQQQPACIPLSYALRFLTDATRQELLKPINQGRSSQTTVTNTNRNKNVTPTGSEAEEGEDLVSEPEDSNDSWTTSEEFSSDYILRYGSRVISQSVTPQNNNADKPFACPVPGCKKRYKNINGIKYHSKNGHKNDGKIRKAFKCSCGKSYKTPYGLKNHASIQHNGSGALQLKSSITPTKGSKIGNDNESGTDTVVIKIPKAKIAAIEDHGYIKSDRSMLSETEIECDSDLGILTPASTPPLPIQSPTKIDQHLPIHTSAKTLQKYLTAAPSANNSRRNIKNEY